MATYSFEWHSHEYHVTTEWAKKGFIYIEKFNKMKWKCTKNNSTHWIIPMSIIEWLKMLKAIGQNYNWISTQFYLAWLNVVILTKSYSIHMYLFWLFLNRTLTRQVETKIFKEASRPLIVLYLCMLLYTLMSLTCISFGWPEWFLKHQIWRYITLNKQNQLSEFKNENESKFKIFERIWFSQISVGWRHGIAIGSAIPRINQIYCSTFTHCGHRNDSICHIILQCGTERK